MSVRVFADVHMQPIIYDRMDCMRHMCERVCIAPNVMNEITCTLLPVLLFMSAVVLEFIRSLFQKESMKTVLLAITNSWETLNVSSV